MDTLSRFCLHVSLLFSSSCSFLATQLNAVLSDNLPNLLKSSFHIELCLCHWGNMPSTSYKMSTAVQWCVTPPICYTHPHSGPMCDTVAIYKWWESYTPRCCTYIPFSAYHQLFFCTNYNQMCMCICLIYVCFVFICLNKNS